MTAGALRSAGTAPGTPGTLRDVWRVSRAETPILRDSGSVVHSGYQRDPVRWLVEQLGIPEHTIRWSKNPGYARHVWDGGTPDPLVAALEGLAAGESVAVPAGTGTQKTYVLGAGALFWFLASFENSIVVTIAPKEDQLKLHLWKEVRRLWPRFHARFPSASVTDLKLRMRGGLDEAWTATGFIAGVGANEEAAGRARGFHAEHALYIFEESPAIDAAIGAAIDFTCTAPHNLQLRLGNPDNEQDELERFGRRAGVRRVRISALDHPNVVCRDPSIVPGATSQKFIDLVVAEHPVGSTLYNAKVRGVAPKESAEALIRWSWCEEAAERYSDLRFRVGQAALGVDVADSPAGDRYAIARGTGACVLELEAHHIGEADVNDASELGERIALEIMLAEIDEQHVGVDSVGVGAATVNKCKEFGLLVQALNGGAAPVYTVDPEPRKENEDAKPFVPVELFRDLRTQIYWTLRQDLMHGRIALPKNERLFRQLTTPMWGKRKGKIYVESKEDLVKRLGSSPDEADAVAYWNYVRERRLPAEDDGPLSAWHPSMLRAEIEATRRVRSRKPRRPRDLPPELIETLD